MRLGTLLGAIAVACVIARVASADVSKEDAARATALFDAGKIAVEAGKIDEGCARFEQSLALDPQLGTRMNLADCREKQNRLVEAYQLYEYSAAEAQQLNKPGRLTYAQKQLERLAAQLVRISLKVIDNSPGLTLQLTTAAGTREVPRGGWGRIIIVDPGPFSVEASAPDRKAIKLERDGEMGTQVEIEIPHLESTLPPPPPPPPPPPRSKLPFLVGGAGVALLGLGGVLVLTADQTSDTQGLVGLGTAVVGAAGIGLGAYLYVKSRRRVVVVPTATGTNAGVSIIARF